MYKLIRKYMSKKIVVEYLASDYPKADNITLMTEALFSLKPGTQDDAHIASECREGRRRFKRSDFDLARSM